MQGYTTAIVSLLISPESKNKEDIRKNAYIYIGSDYNLSTHNLIMGSCFKKEKDSFHSCKTPY